MKFANRVSSVTFAAACAAFTLIVSAVPAHAQWTVINLHPAGTDRSAAHGGSGAQQVGVAFYGDFFHAGLWSGTADSWVDLHPPGAVDSQATASNGSQQGGVSRFEVGGPYRASLWSGTAASWVNLHPAGASSSAVAGMSGSQPVGFAQFSGPAHAGLWSGTAESWVDLHPAGAVDSVARASNGSQQVGSTRWSAGNLERASLWSGTADSWVDLHPSGATGSVATGVYGTQQVGYASYGGWPFYSRAGLWSGTADSWVELHPPGAVLSFAHATNGSQQVGEVNSRAAVWSGTADSWVDLHALLPGGNIWTSTAEAIWTDGGYTYVAGSVRFTDGLTQAILWVQPVPEPASLGLLVPFAAMMLRRRRGARLPTRRIFPANRIIRLSAAGAITSVLLTAVVSTASAAASLTPVGFLPGQSSSSAFDVGADGNYRATLLAAGITTPAGAPPAEDHVFAFFFLNGGANRDGQVNLADFNILAANFGQTNRTFSDGDFTYDAVVNLLDFNILASRFGQILTASTAGQSIFGFKAVGESLDRNDSRPELEDLT